MDDLTEVRPKLKQNSIFLQTGDGVFLQSDAAVFSLKGKSAYQLLAALSPHMNGEHTVRELCEGLAPAQQATVMRLVDTLLQRGVLKRSLPETPGLLSDAVLERFRPQIELIDHYADRPVERFKVFRQSRVLLVGAGESFVALGTALIRNGVREIFLAALDDPDNFRQQLEDEADNVRQSGVEVLLSSIDFDPRAADAFQHATAYDIVVYCADTSSFKDVLALQKNSRQQGCMFLPLVFFMGQCVLGPLVKPQGPCWLCAQIRLAANAEGDRATAVWKALVLDSDLINQDSTFFTPMARQVGNALGFELFKVLAGHLPSELMDGIICQDSETLESYHGNLIAYPLCPLCSQDDPDSWMQRTLKIVTGKQDKEVISSEDLLRQAGLLIHKLTGLVNSYQDDTLIQLPLKISRLNVSSPALSTSQRIEVTTFHTATLLDARVSALSEAIRQYTLSLPDTRTMLLTSWNELAKQGKTALMAQRLSTWSGISTFTEDTRCEWLPACSLFTQRSCYVPAAAIYPSSYLNRRSVFEKTSAGSTACTTFKEVLTSGLTSACAYEHMREVLQRRIPVLPLAPETLENIDTDLTFLLRSIKHFEHPYSLFEVLPASPLHLILACTNDANMKHLFGIGFGLSGIQATHNALLQLVGKLQVLKYEKHTYMFNDPFFPEFTSRADFVSTALSMSRFQEPAVTIQKLEEHVREQGRDILFVNTTTTDVWESGVFITGTVLLTKPEK